MNLRQFKDLPKNIEGLYDLGQHVLANGNSLNVFGFPLTDRHTMRIDLVAADAYGSKSEALTIMLMNDIINPLSVKSGDVLLVIDRAELHKLTDKKNEIDKLRSAFIDKAKAKRVDPSRTAFKASERERENAKLPPSVLPEGTEAFTLEGGKIKINPGF